jgi:predicted ATP-grasp superfamily ATP-dependent carboligase
VINVIKFLEAVFAIIGVLATLFAVAVAVSGDSIVKYLEETAQKLQERTEQLRKEKESK